MASGRLRKIVAVGIGAIGALLPVVLANGIVAAQLDRYVVEQMRDEADGIAAGVARRLDSVAEAVGELASDRVWSCDASHVFAMRRKVFTTAILKEVKIVEGSGRALCSHVGSISEPLIKVEEILIADKGVFISLRRDLIVNETVLQLRRPGLEAGRSLVALVPLSSLLPGETGAPGATGQRVELRTGARTGIERSGGRGATAPWMSGFGGGDKGAVSVTVAVPRHDGLAVQVVRSGEAIAAGHAGIVESVQVVSIAAVAVIALLIYLLLRRHRGNPLSELKAALENDEFIPFYQPIVDTESGKLVGAEVLARWRKPDGTLVSPGKFIPLAERSGLIVPMTVALMRQVRREMAEVVEHRPTLKLGFNLCADHFRDDTVVRDVRTIFGDGKVRMSQLTFEVTERDPLGDLNRAREIIAALQEQGCKVALDDVGTGHGGLSYLLKLGIDIIKIDKMFVDAIGTERYSATIIESLIDLARQMRMDIVAEGVETYDQVIYLRERGVTMAQGFVFSPPLPCASFTALVEAMDPVERPAAPVVAEPRYYSARSRVLAPAA